MDPDLRAILIVVVAGSVVFGIGLTGLALAFRRFGRSDAGSPTHLAVLAGLVTFILICCALLLLVAYRAP
jgi:hypothetical protein